MEWQIHPPLDLSWGGWRLQLRWFPFHHHLLIIITILLLCCYYSLQWLTQYILSHSGSVSHVSRLSVALTFLNWSRKQISGCTWGSLGCLLTGKEVTLRARYFLITTWRKTTILCSTEVNTSKSYTTELNISRCNAHNLRLIEKEESMILHKFTSDNILKFRTDNTTLSSPWGRLLASQDCRDTIESFPIGFICTHHESHLPHHPVTVTTISSVADSGWWQNLTLC